MKLTIHLTKATITVNDTNIPAQVIIENTTEIPVKFYFNSSLLMSTDFKGVEFVEFVVPARGKVRTRPRAFLPSIELQLITLEPGENYVGDVNLAQFLEVIDAGEYEVGINANLRYYRKDEEIGKSIARTMSGQTAIRFHVKK